MVLLRGSGRRDGRADGAFGGRGGDPGGRHGRLAVADAAVVHGDPFVDVDLEAVAGETGEERVGQPAVLEDAARQAGDLDPGGPARLGAELAGDGRDRGLEAGGQDRRGRPRGEPLEEPEEGGSRVVDEQAVAADEPIRQPTAGGRVGGHLEVDRRLRLELGHVAQAEQAARGVEEAAGARRERGVEPAAELDPDHLDLARIEPGEEARGGSVGDRGREARVDGAPRRRPASPSISAPRR